jgi:hypothetical protein
MNFTQKPSETFTCVWQAARPNGQLLALEMGKQRSTLIALAMSSSHTSWDESATWSGGHGLHRNSEMELRSEGLWNTAKSAFSHFTRTSVNNEDTPSCRVISVLPLKSNSSVDVAEGTCDSVEFQMDTSRPEVGQTSADRVEMFAHSTLNIA